MRSYLLGAIGACVITLGVTTSANSAVLSLESRLGGLAYYDPNLEITWVQDANIHGMMDWYTVTRWASTLDLGGVIRWLLSNMDRDGDGDINAVPVPTAVYLFGSGLLGLLFKKHQTTKRKFLRYHFD